MRAPSCVSTKDRALRFVQRLHAHRWLVTPHHRSCHHASCNSSLPALAVHGVAVDGVAEGQPALDSRRLTAVAVEAHHAHRPKACGVAHQVRGGERERVRERALERRGQKGARERGWLVGEGRRANGGETPPCESDPAPQYVLVLVRCGGAGCQLPATRTLAVTFR